MSSMTPVFDPRDAALHRDPYPLYDRLRREDPVHRSPYGMWVLSRYTDVRAALRDPRLSSRPSRFSVHARRAQAGTPASEAVRHMVTFLDAPEHTRLRRLLARVITDHLAEDLRSIVQAEVDALLAPHWQRGSLDLVTDFAALLPVRVIAGMLGIPEQDRGRLKAWSSRFFDIFSPLPDRATLDGLNRAIIEFRAYVEDLVEERRQRPGPDVISRLVQVRDQGDALSADELVTSCMLLFANGEETLCHLLGNGLHALLRQASEWQRLVRQPQLVRSAVEEMQRFDTPSQAVGRTALEPIEWHGRRIPAGAPVYLLIGSANRDPDRFEQPDRLDIGRADIEHLGFGAGPHACLGAGIARVEAQVALSTLARMCPDACLGADVFKWRADVFVRGLHSLPIRFTPPA
jgi:pimeloyl-[acyl-carrier protein] synthase